MEREVKTCDAVFLRVSAILVDRPIIKRKAQRQLCHMTHRGRLVKSARQQHFTFPLNIKWRVFNVQSCPWIHWQMENAQTISFILQCNAAPSLWKKWFSKAVLHRWTHLSFLKALGRYLFGNHMAMAHISTHRMASSSNIWPRKLRVAWKYVDPMPETQGQRRHGKEFVKEWDTVEAAESYSFVLGLD